MQKTKHFALLLFPGFSALCLANAVEPLRAANSQGRRSLYSWQFHSWDGGPVQSSSDMPVQTEPLRGRRGDYLFVMPSYGHLQNDTAEARRRLRQAAGSFKTLVGLDTGSWLLASAGLMEGYRATSHWDVLDAFEERFTETTVTRDRFVIDRDRASCGGATTTLDLMLRLIETHHGASLALEVAALFMYGERDPANDPTQSLPAHKLVRAAAALMRRNVENPMKISALSMALGVNQRTLETTFRAETGQSPVRLYRAIRLGEARLRVEQTRETIAEIASRTGYGDPAAMTRAFRQEYGVPPSALRRSVQTARRGS